MGFWPFQKALDLPKLAVDTVVDATAVVRGDLRSGGGLRVDGTVHGRVESDGAVIVGEKGVVAGSVVGTKAVVVLGRVRGDVVTEGELHIGPQGSVLGDVRARAIHVLRGAALLGRSAVGDEERARAALPAVSVPPSAPALPRVALPEPLSGRALAAATAPEPSQDVRDAYDDPSERLTADAVEVERATVVAPSAPPPVPAPKGRTLPPPNDAAVPPPASGAAPSDAPNAAAPPGSGPGGVVQSGIMPTAGAREVKVS